MSILEWLDGKKAVLLAIAGLLISYLTTSKVINAELGTLILSILNVLGGGAAIATNRVLGAKTRELSIKR